MSGKDKQENALTLAMKEKLKRATGYCCEFCGEKVEPHHLVIHHIDWESQSEDDVKDENTPSNLISLCLFHHADCHGPPIKIKNSELKERIRQRPEKVHDKIKSILENPAMIDTVIFGKKMKDIEEEFDKMNLPERL
jgi:hypothetical protein